MVKLSSAVRVKILPLATQAGSWKQPIAEASAQFLGWSQKATEAPPNKAILRVGRWVPKRMEFAVAGICDNTDPEGGVNMSACRVRNI